jgi:hypothetical protein
LFTSDVISLIYQGRILSTIREGLAIQSLVRFITIVLLKPPNLQYIRHEPEPPSIWCDWTSCIECLVFTISNFGKCIRKADIYAFWGWSFPSELFRCYVCRSKSSDSMFCYHRTCRTSFKTESRPLWPTEPSETSTNGYGISYNNRFYVIPKDSDLGREYEWLTTKGGMEFWSTKGEDKGKIIMGTRKRVSDQGHN